MIRSKWRYALVVGALLALVGAGAAWAGLGLGGAKDRDALLDDVAKRLGVSRDKLDDAFQDALVARVDAAVKDGRLTETQGDAIKKRIRAGDVGPLGLGHGFGPGLGLGPGPGHGPGGGLLFGPGGPHGLEGAAEFLGLSAEELHEQLRDGKSLADIAKDKDKSADDLRKAILDSARKQLDQAVENERLTRDQARTMLERLEAALPDLIEKSWERPGPGRGFRGGGAFPGQPGAPRGPPEAPPIS